MEEQEGVGATGAGGAGSGAGLQDGAAAGLRLAGTSLYCVGLSPRPVFSSTDERPRGILKNTSSILVQRVPCGEKKKSQHWDEMNILATYHPLGKDCGLMKVDEPSTPYHRLEDSDEDLRAGTSQAVSPEALTERFASLDSFCPKVLQFGYNQNTGSKDKLTSKKMQKDFEWHRKAHYDEGKYLKAQKLAAQDEEEEPPGTSGLTWVIEKPLTSQGVHLVGLAGQAPSGEQKATEKPLTITITQSQPGTALTQKHNGSPVISSCCHWLVTKELSWKRPEIPDKDAGESQGARRHESQGSIGPGIYWEMRHFVYTGVRRMTLFNGRCSRLRKLGKRGRGRTTDTPPPQAMATQRWTIKKKRSQESRCMGFNK
uniref:Uncharacterized protein LOC110194313 isoform X2 n=1 Tax=Phascolarctos cinereus TaxID=38626 RepID=A0A6P5ITD3_PHACI|nr:uncharacterized protein LOC110194313 isoform X2 [Phascolarctos cinereus]